MSQLRRTARLVATAMLLANPQAELLEVTKALLRKLTNLLEFKEALPAEPGRVVAGNFEFAHKKRG